MSEQLDRILKTYVIAPEGAAIVQSTRSLFLTGIIGAGKDSIKKGLLTTPEYQDFYHEIVTDTTRAMRENDNVMEIDGTDYNFVTQEQMYQQLVDGIMVECNPLNGNYYGTRVEQFAMAAAEDRIALGDIDVNGIRSFRKIAPESATAIFVVPTNYDVWRQRAESRYADPEDFKRIWVSRRLTSIAELTHALAVPDYHFVINDDLARATEVVHKIAHREVDSFKRKDDEARLRARDLLAAIEEAA